MRVPLPFTLMAAVALVSLAACGGGASPTPTGGGTAAPSSASAAPTGAGTAPASAIQCGAGSGGTAATIANFAFAPNPVTVSSGGNATWSNKDTTTHTVTFDSGPDCGRVAAGASVSVQFSAPGTYAYHCSIHPSMKGSVTVSG